VPGWRETFATAVREAFGVWEAAAIPVRFAFLESADDAEVRVTWAERLPDQRAGLAHWTADADGWIERVHLEFATWVSDGTRANEASMRRIALHEIGHLLGLEHSQDPADVMGPWVIATAPTGRDHATARLLYKLPPGRLDPAWRAPMPGVAAGG
jgi:hypothetical protein